MASLRGVSDDTFTISRDLVYSPNLDVSSAVNPGPHAQHVLPAADAEHGPTDFIAGIAKLVPDDRQQQVLPVPVGHTFLEPHNPLAALFVGLILPHRTDTLFENVVVGDCGQQRRPLEVGVDGPEALDRRYCCQSNSRLLVVRRLWCGRPVPEHPGCLQRMLVGRGRRRRRRVSVVGRVCLVLIVCRGAWGFRRAKGGKGARAQAEGVGGTRRRRRNPSGQRRDGVKGIGAGVGAIGAEALGGMAAGKIGSDAVFVGRRERQPARISVYNSEWADRSLNSL